VRFPSAAAKSICLVLLLAVVAGAGQAVHAAVAYPLNLKLAAKLVDDTSTTVTTTVTLQLDRLMEQNRFTRVSDALKYGGYGNFLPALRALPAIGTIEVRGRSVSIKYAREEEQGSGPRLVIVADRPLFFLDPVKSKAGYELTMMELFFDPQGGVTGRLLGAARVKTSPDGAVLDDFTDIRVDLEGRVEKR
jgi:hypothetical protein